MSAWKPIAEAPKDGTEIDVFVWDAIMGCGWREIEVAWRPHFPGCWSSYSLEGGYERVGFPGFQEPIFFMLTPDPPGEADIQTAIGG